MRPDRYETAVANDTDRRGGLPYDGIFDLPTVYVGRSVTVGSTGSITGLSTKPTSAFGSLGRDRTFDGTETALPGEALSGIEGLTGTSGNDRLTGNAQANAFFSNGGDDRILLGGGDNRLGFGKGLPLTDVFSFPGRTGQWNLTVMLEERLAGMNPQGDDAPPLVNGEDRLPLGRMIANEDSPNECVDMGSLLWGQEGRDTLDMRFDQGISFAPSRADDWGGVDLDIARAKSAINVYTGKHTFWGAAK